jgi:hypothetical protein
LRNAGLLRRLLWADPGLAQHVEQALALAQRYALWWMIPEADEAVLENLRRLTAGQPFDLDLVKS